MAHEAAVLDERDVDAPPMVDADRLSELAVKEASPPKAKAAVIKPSERSPGKGWTRYRLRAATTNGVLPVEYILAQSRADAEAEYVKAHNLGPRMAKVRGLDGKDVDVPNWTLSVVQMPD